MVCVDDGTKSIDILRARVAKAQQYGFKCIQHGQNRGIPAAWNTIVNHAAENKSEVVVIFNDDIRLLSPGWLTRLVTVFENNQRIATVGLPLCNEPNFDDSQSEKMWGKTPGLVGCAVGCAFAGQPETLLLVENPDGTRGYWEDLVSFHEELQVGFKLAEKGYGSYMLPWPPVYHMGGATFGASPELTWRNPSDYLPMGEFLRYARSSRWYVKQYEDIYEQGRCDRMMYSRAMFCKYWGILGMDRQWIDPLNGDIVDIHDEPQRYVHRQVVDQLQGREIAWLNKIGVVEKAIV